MASYPAEYFETRFRVATPVAVWPRAFVILTAWATTGEVWTDAQNTQADAVLEAELRAEGRWLVRVTGYSPTTGHEEPGWAVDLQLHDALEVGHRYKQDAIYVVRRDVLSVIRCEPGMPMAVVGTFSARVDVGG